jgi:predicted PurR-regulated permease PerM
MAKQEQVYSFFLLGILAVSLYFAFEVLSPFLHVMVLAIILATLLHPLHQRLRARIGGRKALSAFISTVLVTVLIILPVLFFLGALFGQAAKSIAALQSWLKDAHLENWLRSETFTPYETWVRQNLPWLEFDLSKLDVKDNLLDFSKRFGQFTLDLGAKMVGNVIGILLNFFIMLFVLFFLFLDGEAMLSQLKHLSPLHDAQEDRILRKLRDVARSVVAGSFLVAICQGVVGGIGLWIVGIPALFWGSMMGFASLIPVVGTMLVWGPAALYLLIVGDFKGALIMTGWGAVIVSSIDSVLRPLLMQGQAQMSTFWVFLSIIGGIKYFGPLGILYGPLVLALAMVMLGIYADEYADVLAGKHHPHQPKDKLD